MVAEARHRGGDGVGVALDLMEPRRHLTHTPAAFADLPLGLRCALAHQLSGLCHLTLRRRELSHRGPGLIYRTHLLLGGFSRRWGGPINLTARGGAEKAPRAASE